MPNSNTDIDEVVDRAVREICAEREDGERVNVAAKAREIGVHKDRLYRRLKGVGPRTTRKPINSKLSVVQEASLMRYILCLDDIGQAVRYDWISHVANAILAEDHTDDDLPPSVGSHWARRFLNRHPELHKARQKPLELERKLAHDPEVISNWFERFQRLQEKYSVQKEDIWNFDETGFQIGVGKSQWIVTASRVKKQYLPSDNNRDYVTAVEAISAGGAVIEPMLILTGKVHLARFYEDLRGDIMIGLSESGYTNDELSYDYIQHFERQSRKTRVRAHRILLCDGFKSHFTREVLEFYEFNLIHVFALPPHTSHILQPLDVVLFQPYKHWYGQILDQATRRGCGKFDKLEFLAAIQAIRDLTLKKSSILAGFRECGLFPRNPAIVIEKVKDYQPLDAPPPLNRPSTPPSAEIWPPTTPLTTQSLEKQATQLKNATPSRQQTL
jgi:DDE superfamily endonuclease/Tc5 transposase DNA-binding domain